jgi:DNA-binding transcriptional LysR family regulator
LYVEVFTHDEMVLVVAPQHPLARDTPEGTGISQAALVAVPFISRERGSGTREVVEEALARCGVVLRPFMSLGSTEAVKNAVAQGLGAAIVSRLTIELELRGGWLRALEIQGVRILRALRLLTLEGKPPSPTVLEFLRLLRERYPAEVLLT